MKPINVLFSLAIAVAVLAVEFPIRIDPSAEVALYASQGCFIGACTAFGGATGGGISSVVFGIIDLVIAGGYQAGFLARPAAPPRHKRSFDLLSGIANMADRLDVCLSDNGCMQDMREHIIDHMINSECDVDRASIAADAVMHNNVVHTLNSHHGKTYANVSRSNGKLSGSVTTKNVHDLTRRQDISEVEGYYGESVNWGGPFTNQGGFTDEVENQIRAQASSDQSACLELQANNVLDGLSSVAIRAATNDGVDLIQTYGC